MRTYKRGGKTYIDIKDPQGIRRRFPVFASKSATEAFGRRLCELRDARIAGMKPDAGQRAWVEGLRGDLREKLAEYGFLDAGQIQASRELVAHLVDYEASMKARGRDARHIRQEIAGNRNR